MFAYYIYCICICQGVGAESSGSKKTKWKTLTGKRAAKKTEESEDEPCEPFRDEAPLGTYNSSDDSSSENEDPDFEMAPSPKKTIEKSPKDDSENEPECGRVVSKFDSLVERRAKVIMRKSQNKMKQTTAELLLKRNVNLSDDDSSCIEIVTSQDSQASESELDDSPFKISLAKRSRTLVISDSESNNSTPMKPKRRMFGKSQKAKTILDIDSDSGDDVAKGVVRVVGDTATESEDLPVFEKNTRCSPSPTCHSDAETSDVPKKSSLKLSTRKSGTDSDSETDGGFFASPLKNGDAKSSKKSSRRNFKSNKEVRSKKRKRVVSSEGSNSESETEGKAKRPRKTKNAVVVKKVIFVNCTYLPIIFSRFYMYVKM